MRMADGVAVEGLRPGHGGWVRRSAFAYGHGGRAYLESIAQVASSATRKDDLFLFVTDPADDLVVRIPRGVPFPVGADPEESDEHLVLVHRVEFFGTAPAPTAFERAGIVTDWVIEPELRDLF